MRARRPMAPSPVKPMLMALIPVDESPDINLNRGAREPLPPRHGKRLVPLALWPPPAGSVKCGISEPPGPCKRRGIAAMEDGATCRGAPARRTQVWRSNAPSWA